MHVHRFLPLLLTLLPALNHAFSLPYPSPRSQSVLHEKRDIPPHGWVKYSRADKEMVLPMRIALKQSNLARIEEYLMSVSHPESEGYGRHWSHSQVVEAFQPQEETVEMVLQWLVSSGVEKKGIRRTRSGGWLEWEGSVGAAERLLGAEYWVWKHEVSGQKWVGCEGYGVPRGVGEHVDFVMPTVHFDGRVEVEGEGSKRRSQGLEKRRKGPRISLKETSKRENSNYESEEGHETRLKGKRKGAGLGHGGNPPSPPRIIPITKPIHNNLTDCANNLIPDCLRALYGMPELPADIRTHPNNSFGIVQYTPQTYVSTDLDLFFSNYSKNQVQKVPTLHSVDGGTVWDNPDLGSVVEANLDLEYAMALANPINVTLYQVGDQIETDFTSFNNFLDSIDATYCSTSDAKDNTTDPIIDAIYPDPLPGGYKGPQNCGDYAVAKVISTSYNYNEHDLTPAYETRQCNEYAKLGLLGTTFIFCSGDYGVAGTLGRCIDPTTNAKNDGSYGLFSPSFPSTCPYVLSVGATQMAPNASVAEPEVAVQTKISSGGGFSNIFPIPSWQNSAVSNWFEKYKPTEFGAERYNNSGSTRGYPDVSVNGAKYVVALEGSYNYHLYGTSASAPVFGAMLTMINEARMWMGKGSVGFINPALYANPWLLNDITQGSNSGCGSEGFNASIGWDPVTGLGTPNYPRMLQYFLSH